MNRKSTVTSANEAPASATRARASRRGAAVAPKPTNASGDEVKASQPAEERSAAPIDPDLRHRLISQAAHALYAERGYADGFDFEDWLRAEAQVDAALLNRAVAKKAE